MAEQLHNLALLITIWQMPLLFPDDAVKIQKVPLGAAIEKKRREIYYEEEVISSIIDRSYGNVHAYRMWRRL